MYNQKIDIHVTFQACLVVVVVVVVVVVDGGGGGGGGGGVLILLDCTEALYASFCFRFLLLSILSFVCIFVFCALCCPDGNLYQWEVRVAFPKGSQLQQSRATQS